MKPWQVHGERTVYEDPWLKVCLADVETPDGHRFEHRVVRCSRSAGAVVLDKRQRVLLIWRHRFITQSWGWEIPSGKIDKGETPIEAAAREVEEETGWRPGRLRPLVYSQPSNGFMDSEDHLFRADGATRVGTPTDASEAARVEWIPLADIPQMIAKREIVGGPTLLALFALLAARPAEA